MKRDRKWKAVYGNGLLSVSVVDMNENGAPVCEVARRGGCRDSEAEEDARLIAAAPRFVDAVENLLGVIECCRKAAVSLECHGYGLDPLRDSIDTVIEAEALLKEVGC